MRILITGATGYVGSALVDDLKGTHEVIATARDISRIRQKDVRALQLDISSPEQAARVMEEVKPDLVIHAAALPKRNHAEEDIFISTNVEGGRTIAQAVKDHSQAKLVFISSGCAFKQQPGAFITENSEREMGTAFSRSKNLAERALLEVFKGEEDRLALIYPPMILHASQEQGIIPYALADACKTGTMVNKVPQGHVNFINHTKLAELIEAIGKDNVSEGVQRYPITGVRFPTEDFFAHLQQMVQEKFDVPCVVKADADPHIETMCAMDESAIQKLKPDFSWGSIDGSIAAILERNIDKYPEVETRWRKQLDPALRPQGRREL